MAFMFLCWLICLIITLSALVGWGEPHFSHCYLCSSFISDFLFCYVLDHLCDHFIGKWSESYPVMSDPLQPYSPWNFPGQNTGVGSLSLLQGIFPTQVLHPGLTHCRWIRYQLSHKGSPRILEWVTYPFSRGSSPSRNQTRVSCIAGGFFTNWAIREAPESCFIGYFILNMSNILLERKIVINWYRLEVCSFWADYLWILKFMFYNSWRPAILWFFFFFLEVVGVGCRSL